MKQYWRDGQLNITNNNNNKLIVDDMFYTFLLTLPTFCNGERKSSESSIYKIYKVPMLKLKLGVSDVFPKYSESDEKELR